MKHSRNTLFSNNFYRMEKNIYNWSELVINYHFVENYFNLPKLKYIKII
jgi:hypothetical protein